MFMCEQYVDYNNEASSWRDQYALEDLASPKLFDSNQSSFVKRSKKDFEFELFSQQSEQYNHDEMNSNIANIDFFPNFNVQVAEYQATEQINGTISTVDAHQGLSELLEALYQPHREEEPFQQFRQEEGPFQQLQQEEEPLQMEECPVQSRETIPQTTQTQPVPELDGASMQLISNPENYIVNCSSDKTFKVSVRPKEEITKFIDSQKPKKNDSKNFPKKLGDQMADYFSQFKDLSDCNSHFKDKTSWKTLTTFGTGEKKIEGVSQVAFIKMFFEFINEKDINDFRKGNSSPTAKIFHMVNFMNLQLACRAIEEYGVKYTAINFKRGFPVTVLECEL